MRAKETILANQNALAHNEVLKRLLLGKEKSKRTEINLFVAH
jgi:hypothetical protein